MIIFTHTYLFENSSKWNRSLDFKFWQKKPYHLNCHLIRYPALIFKISSFLVLFNQIFEQSMAALKIVFFISLIRRFCYQYFFVFFAHISHKSRFKTLRIIRFFLFLSRVDTFPQYSLVDPGIPFYSPSLIPCRILVECLPLASEILDTLEFLKYIFVLLFLV